MDNYRHDKSKTSKLIYTLIAVACLQLLLFFASVPVMAAKYDFSYKTVSGGETYDTKSSYVNVDYMDMAGYYRLYLVKSGRYLARHRVNGITGTAVANGRYVYYAIKPVKGNNYYAPKTVYRYDFKKDTFKKICELDGLVDIIAFNGKYLFYSKAGGTVPALYRYSISTKKTKKIDEYSMRMEYKDGKYLTHFEPGDGESVSYLLNKDGSGKKKICRAIHAAIMNKKVYYVKLITYKGTNSIVKVYSVNFNGKNRKAVTGKIKYSSLPKKHKKIFNL